jgi:hypothetical protein
MTQVGIVRLHDRNVELLAVNVHKIFQIEMNLCSRAGQTFPSSRQDELNLKRQTFPRPQTLPSTAPEQTKPRVGRDPRMHFSLLFFFVSLMANES